MNNLRSENKFTGKGYITFQNKGWSNEIKREEIVLKNFVLSSAERRFIQG